MDVEQDITNYIASQVEAKRNDMQALHQLIRAIKPESKIWFLDGKDSNGKIVSNPNVGYGSYTIQYANGTSKEFYQIGMSGNTTGISIYILGLDDKAFLANTFGSEIGKASVSGYCIKFKKLSDIVVETLEAAIRHGFAAHPEK